MRKVIVTTVLIIASALVIMRCKEDLAGSSSMPNSSASTSSLTAVAQTSGQLASGTSFRINGTSSDSSGPAGPGRHPGPGRDHMPSPLDGTFLLAPTTELLTIIEAESAGDFRGMRMHSQSGATIKNYDASGNPVALTAPAGSGPQGCSFSGGQFPYYDSLLATITKTVIDFGSGITEKHDTVTIIRSGKIIITRSSDNLTKTETVTFENYTVNGNLIEGTKTRVNSFVLDNGTGSGTSTTSVTGGKITFSDGTIAIWTGDKQRMTSIAFDTHNRPSSGEITTAANTYVITSDGTVIYSHHISKTIVENMACHEHHGPVSGTVETVYRANSISIDFGDGTCANKTVTITINGVTTTKEVL
jgi:hypothetical protein